jgi:hypothetical protein
LDLARIFASQTCPVCGYKLDFHPWSIINKVRACPCCGINAGLNEIVEAQPEAIYLAWRKQWVSHGHLWWSTESRPVEYDPVAQLSKLVDLDSGAPPSLIPLCRGDWVKTESGDIGQIALVSRMSAFVDIQRDEKMESFNCLLSELDAVSKP